MVHRRLHNQRLLANPLRRPEDVVAWFGAMQAQEFEPAKWGIALRLAAARGVAATIQRAFDAGRILRTHVMRPTWHFVAAADIRWLLELTAPHVHRTMAIYNRRMELDARILNRGTAIVERALGDGGCLTRAELAERLARAGIPIRTQRLAHLMIHAELEAVVCSGPRRDNRMTYALVAERSPKARRLPRDEALAILCRRFLRSHGPATVRDFSWWSGLPAGDARRGIEIVRAVCDDVDGVKYWRTPSAPARLARATRAHLLPIYDEYIVAYRDREMVPHGPALQRGGGWVTFRNALIVDGQVAGTWGVKRGAKRTDVTIAPMRRFDAKEQDALTAARRRYQSFLSQ
jgi:hypothetical protein